ncbi:MAG: hypothetical protein LAO21_21745 [Acidobacteriia bacterium]|nr:hypothetical protein [Terriglobia bacterium]
MKIAEGVAKTTDSGSISGSGTESLCRTHRKKRDVCATPATDRPTDELV